MVIDSEEAVSMQLQFNNSPLGGGGGIKPWKGETRLFFFPVFLVMLLFLVFEADPPPLPRDGRKDRNATKERWLVFHVLLLGLTPQLVQWDAAEAVIDWMPLTEWTLSQAVLSTPGCVYWCVLPAKSRHQHHCGQQQQQHEGPDKLQ